LIEIFEPFPVWAWPQAWAWYEPYIRLMDDSGPRTPEKFVESYWRLAENGRTFAIWKDGILSGVVAAERFAPSVMNAHILVARRLWGIAPGELREVARRLFDSDPALARIQAFVPGWNRLACALAKRLGGVEEGTMRAALLREGKPADCVLYGLTREDFNSGSVSRGIIREPAGDEQEFRDSIDDLLADAGGIAIDIGGTLLESGSVDRDRSESGERDGGADGLGGLDQQNIGRPDGPDDEVPLKPGTRKQRANRKGSAPGRARARKRPRGE
jgi:hypothetical protein